MSREGAWAASAPRPELPDELPRRGGRFAQTGQTVGAIGATGEHLRGGGALTRRHLLSTSRDWHATCTRLSGFGSRVLGSGFRVSLDRVTIATVAWFPLPDVSAFVLHSFPSGCQTASNKACSLPRFADCSQVDVLGVWYRGLRFRV